MTLLRKSMWHYSDVVWQRTAADELSSSSWQSDLNFVNTEVKIERCVCLSESLLNDWSVGGVTVKSGDVTLNWDVCLWVQLWVGRLYRKWRNATETFICVSGSSPVKTNRGKHPHIQHDPEWTFHRRETTLFRVRVSTLVHFSLEMFKFRTKANSKKHTLPVCCCGYYFRAEMPLSVWRLVECSDVGVMKQQTKLKNHWCHFLLRETCISTAYLSNLKSSSQCNVRIKQSSQ